MHLQLEQEDEMSVDGRITRLDQVLLPLELSMGLCESDISTQCLDVKLGDLSDGLQGPFLTNSPAAYNLCRQASPFQVYSPCLNTCLA